MKSSIFNWLLLLLIGGTLYAETREGDAGVESLFDAIGVSAKDMSMGRTAVAYPDNMGAFLWNPGGMVVIDQKCIGLSQTTIFEGTQYHFISYIHPTLTAGTFGFGIARIGLTDIQNYEYINNVPVYMGEFDYWKGKISLAYAHHLFYGLSIGLNFEANRQELGPYNTNGFGLDAGLHFHAPVQGGIFRHLYWGLNVKNLIRPRMKLGASTESLPTYYRTGFAKRFVFGNSNAWAILWDFEKHPYKDATHHIGTEFNWRGLAFLRMGMDHREFTFGGGLRWKGFQIDYGSSPTSDPGIFPRSHRFSLSLFLGKSIPDQKRAIQEAEEQKIRQQVQEREQAERRKRIQEGIQLGKQYFENNDYFNARLTFSRVLSEDADNTEAQKYLTMTKDKERVQQQEREQELRKQSAEEESQRRDKAFVREKYEEGLQALDQADFQRAIQRWEEALSRDPDNEQIKSYIEKAKVELEKEVNRLIAQANSLIRQENIAQARRVLDRARTQTENNQRLHNKVMVEIRRLDNTVNFINNYQLGRENYEKGNYKSAANFMEKALQLQPNNEQVRELYRSARARSIGVKKEMSSDVKKQFAEGLRLYSEAKYHQALAAWEKALEMDPKNIKIIESIDVVKRKIQQSEQE
ncbi:PorV/PorQ family protein [bacterium]|nr:PorV/PorQ family protein [bacterium]